jgi:hypothetical protein
MIIRINRENVSIERGTNLYKVWYSFHSLFSWADSSYLCRYDLEFNNYRNNNVIDYGNLSLSNISL